MSKNWFILPVNATAMRIDANLAPKLCFRCDIRKRVEHNSTAANYLLRFCDVNICIAFAFAESSNGA